MSSSASPEFESGRTIHFPTKVFTGHTDQVWSVAYFRDGRRMVSGSRDKTVRTWNVESGEQNWQSPEHDREVQWISISPDDRTLAVSGERMVFLWNLESRSVVWKTEGVDGYRVAFSPDRQLIAATAGYDMVLLDAETGEQVREPLQFGEEVYCLAFSPDGTQLVAGTEQGSVRVFDVATGKTVVGPINAHANHVTSALFTPDGKQFITAAFDKSIRVWDASTGHKVGDPMLGHSNVVRQIALSHDGRRLASAGWDGTVRVWDRNTRRQLGDPLWAQDNTGFVSTAWSPDDQSIIAGTVDGSICLWDVPPHEVEDLPDTTTPPVVVAGNPPQASPSRPRTVSLSPSIINLPAAAPPPINSKSNPPPLPDDFWDSSDTDLPGRARTQISTVPITEVPLKPAIPRTSKAKTAPNVPSASPPASNSFFSRIGSRFRRAKHTPEIIEMQLPPPKIPKYSPVGKVALGQADAGQIQREGTKL
ncbi:quinon protein alcohol dehydrogenase-like superfamily [Hygrophoropsis aurantiaca]|uniref:Quinon protein alcohol dehydrogenase-like superfamily n=1 Tax=Hygrophoropsis aurantiaca TaxID=72124 RepID=A0ACB8A1A3_9AGAM|nr:quinon protein alcohol dehydrogenase-like superfamily [Hygrophoropsis aurantiaca]